MNRTESPRHRRTRGRRRGRGTAVGVGVAVVGGLVGSGVLVWNASYAAFSASTDNTGNKWTAGSVALTDNDAAAAMFNATGLKPGSTDSKCITVTYNGDLASGVKLYASNLVDADSLGENINLTIDEGTGSSGFGDCTGFSSSSQIYSGDLAAFAAASTDYATGVGTWTPNTAAQTKVYKFTYTMDANTPNTVQGKSATCTFTWEAQNT